LEIYSFAIDPKDQDKRLNTRVCDEAARTIHQHRPDLKFNMEGDYKALDEQIKAIQEKLANKPK